MSFVIETHEIRDGGGLLEKEFVLDTAWLSEALSGTELAAPDAFSTPLKVRARMVGDDVLIDASVAAKVLVPCSRCNEPVPMTMGAEFSQLFTTGQEHLPEELELTPEDLERETFDGERLSLDAFVREYIMLEVPMTPACEGGCKDPVVRKILKLDEHGNLPPIEKKPGPLAALGDLAELMKKSEQEKKGSN